MSKDKQNKRGDKSAPDDPGPRGDKVDEQPPQELAKQMQVERQKLALERQAERERREAEQAPIKAVNSLYDILKPLEPTDRQKVIDSVLILLGMKD